MVIKVSTPNPYIPTLMELCKPLHLHSFSKLAVLVLLFCCSVAKAQSLQMAQTDGLVAYSETIEVKGVSKAQLLERAQLWLMGNHHTMSFISEEMGMISVANSIPFQSEKSSKKASVDGRIVYVATLLVQDGVFMYEFNNFYHEADQKASHPFDLGFVTAFGTENRDLNKEWKVAVMNQVRKDIDAAMQKNIESLKKTLLNENLSFNLNVNGK